MDFQESIKQCFQQYANFNGRAKRPEYWWFALFCLLGSLALGIFNDALSGAFSLITLLPSLAVGSRRLHDINKSGWLQLLWGIPVLGWLVLIYFFAQPGNLETNQYGEPPLK